MNKEKKGNFRSFWFKYSEYEMLEIANKHYITPKEDSKVAMYDPFDVADEILVDILMIGRYIEKNDIESSNDAIMKFVNKYGLLGELTYLPLNSNIVVQNKVYLPKNNLLSEKEVMKKYWEEHRNGIVLTHCNTKTLQKLESYGLIEIIYDSTGEDFGIDTIKVLNY